MIITYKDAQYPFDLDTVRVKQGLAIEEFMGCSFDEWGKKLMAGTDLRARQALGWLILTGGDVAVPVGDTDFEMVTLGQALDAAYQAENPAPAQADPGPTAPAAASTGQAPDAADSAKPPASSPVTSPPSSDPASP